MDLSIGGLRAVAALADELHFGRAAARLGISQQALSKRVAVVEAQLGVRIVERGEGRGVALTPSGHEILPFVREAVTANDRITGRAVRRGPRIRVDTLGDYLAPHAWTIRAARDAGLDVEVVQRPVGATAERLLLGDEADFSFGRPGAVPQPWPPDLCQQPLLLEPLAVLCGRGHPWAGLESVRVTHLRGEALWFPLAAAPHEWRSYVAAFAEDWRLEIATEGSTFGFQQWSDDIAYNRVPPSLIGEAMAPPHPGCVLVPIVAPTPVFPWSLWWRAGTSDAAVDDFRRALGFPHGAPTIGRDVWLPEPDASALAGESAVRQRTGR